MVVGNFGAVISGTVDIPSNAQSLIIFSKGASTAYQLETIIGGTTGFPYYFGAMDFPTSGPYTSMYVAVATPGVDASVTLTWDGIPADGWVVVADTGVRAVLDQSLYALAAVNGVADSGAGVAILGQSGGKNYELETDDNGRLIPLVPTAASSIVGAGTLLAAPSSGANYLFGWDFYSESAALDDAATLEVGGTIIAYSRISEAGATQTGIDHIQLDGFRTTAAVTIVGAANGAASALRYTTGP